MASEQLQVRVGANISNYERNMKKLAPIAKKQAKRISRDLKVASLAVAALGAFSIKLAADFEHSLNITAAVAGATGKEFEKLETRARELGRTTAFTSAQVTQGMYGYASAGLKVKDINIAIADSLELAGAMAYDLDSTTNLLISTLKIFGLQTSETTRISDTFVTAVTNSMLTMEKFTFAMQFAGPVAASFGMTIEETSASLAVLANIGLMASRIGTTFRMSMLRAAKGAMQLRDMSTDASIILAKYGVTAREINPELVGFIGMLKAVAKTSMGAAEAMLVFGRRAGASIVTLARQLKEGRLGYDEILKSITEGGGKAAEIYQRMLRTVKNQTKLAKAAFEDLSISLFKTYEPQIRSTLAFLTSFFNNLNTLITTNQKPILKFFKDLAESAVNVGKNIVEGSIGVISGITPLIKGAIGFISKAYETWAGLPTPFKELGLLGMYLLGSKYGKWVLGFAAISGYFQEIAKQAGIAVGSVNAQEIAQKKMNDRIEEALKFTKMSNEEYKGFWDIVKKSGTAAVEISKALLNSGVDYYKITKEGNKEITQEIRVEIQTMDDLEKAKTKAGIQDSKIMAAFKKLLNESVGGVKKLIKAVDDIEPPTMKAKEAFADALTSVQLFTKGGISGLNLLNDAAKSVLFSLAKADKEASEAAADRMAQLLGYVKQWAAAVETPKDAILKQIKLLDEMADKAEEFLKGMGTSVIEVRKHLNNQLEELNQEALQQSVDAYNEQVDSWNDAVDSMAGTFKSAFIETAKGDFEDFGEWWESMLDRLQNALLDTVATMVTDWIAGMFKMQQASNIKVNAQGGGLIGGIIGGGINAAGGGAPIAGNTGLGGTLTSIGKNAGMTIISKQLAPTLLTRLGITPALISNIPGLGGLLTTTTVGGTAVPAGFGGAAGAGVAGSAGGVAWTKALGNILGALGIVAAGYSSGSIGYAIGQNVGTTRGKASATATASGIGAAGGAAGGALIGAQMGSGGGPIGAVIGAVIGLLVGLVKTIGSGDPTKRRRQAKGGFFSESLEGLRGGEYGSLGQFAGAIPDELRSANYLGYAQQYKGLPQTRSGIEFGIQQQAGEFYRLATELGGSAAATGGSLNVMTKEMEAYSAAIGARFPESAKKTQELIDKMKGLWKQDLLKRFDMGIGRLKTTRKQLQNMGMEDAETKAKLYDMAMENLFSKTMSLGDVQIKRMIKDMQELKTEMREDAEAAKGLEIMMALIADGMVLTSDEIQKFTKNAVNLRKLNWLDVYEAMGIEQFELAPEKMEDVNDVIDALRETLNTARASLEGYAQVIENLPESMNALKESMLEVYVATTWLMDIGKEMLDVWENLANFDEFWKDLEEAIEAGDWMAIADSLMDASLAATDLMEVATMLEATFNTLGLTQVAGVFDLIAKAVMGVAMALEIVFGLILMFKIFVDGAKMVSEFFLELERLAGSTALKDYTEQVSKDLQTLADDLQNMADEWRKQWGWIGEIIAFVLDVFSLFVLSWKEIWDEISGIGDDELLPKDIGEFLYRLQRISEEVFKSMTVDVANYLDEFNKMGAEIEAGRLGKELGQYLDFIAVNWADLVEQFGEDKVRKLIASAGEAYGKMLDELVEAAVQAWTDFANEIKSVSEQLGSQIAREQAIIAGGTAGEGEYAFWQAEIDRLKGEAGGIWAGLAKESDPAKRLALWQQAFNMLQQQMNAELSAVTAFYDEKRRLAQENYDDEIKALNEKNEDVREALSEMSDLFSKKAGFIGSIDATLEDVRGAGPSGAVEEFNRTRREITRIKGELTTATGDKKEDLLFDLKDQYDKLWRFGKDVYQDDWEAFARLQEEMTLGLTELRNEGEQYFDTEIDIWRDQLTALTGIEQAVGEDWEDFMERANDEWGIATKLEQEAIEQKLEDELERIRKLEAAERQAILIKYQGYFNIIGKAITDEGLTIGDKIRTAFEDALVDFLANTLDYQTDIGSIADYVQKIWEIMGGVDAPGGNPVTSFNQGVDILAAFANMMPEGVNKEAVKSLWTASGSAKTDAGSMAIWLQELQSLAPILSRYSSGGSNIQDLLAFFTGYTIPVEPPTAPVVPTWSDVLMNLPKTLSAMKHLDDLGGHPGASHILNRMLSDENVTSAQITRLGELLDFNKDDFNHAMGSWTRARSYEVPNVYNELVSKGYKHGGIIPETGPYMMHKNERVFNPAMGGSFGNAAMNQNNTNTYIFVPYNTSEEEQDRLVREVVKPRLQEISENEQFIYDNAIIKTNTGT